MLLDLRRKKLRVALVFNSIFCAGIMTLLLGGLISNRFIKEKNASIRDNDAKKIVVSFACLGSSYLGPCPVDVYHGWANHRLSFLWKINPAEKDDSDEES